MHYVEISLITTYLKKFDGQSRATINFAKGLSKHGVKVKIVSLGLEDGIKEELKNNDIEVISLDQPRSVYYDISLLFGSPSPFKKIANYVNDSISIVTNDEAVPVVNSIKGRIIYWSQGALMSVFLWKPFYAKKGTLKRLVSLFLVRNSHRFSDFVSKYHMLLANSNTSALVVSLFYNRVPQGVVYPPIDIDSFKYSSEKEKFALVILKRSYPTHIDLLRKIANSGIKLKVIGYKIDGAEYLGDRVDEERLRDLYSSALVTLYPVDFEYFGYIPVESMASGTPVIAFKYSGGPSESIIHDETGWLVSNEKEFYEVTLKVYERGYEEALPQKCRNRAEYFSLLTQSKRLLSYIHQSE
ncbi:glycosyltransferase [Sulfolobus acidocaldarius]|uniref:Glycosyl transferase group 1 n=4 Tax=Sulfolobus acidocaldarius TaxID=2285 RepID=Q4J7L4_SULAC|nr:glycosyltransferase [Sulfolobus acidocaldarius]AAY81217.1 glycosyl transferase group 1 [Sulfolobus acidocaldarius DSM 639]AGE71837.1 glycosyl transferase group 1 [Sulfolobus acidocaldarius N8]AGE74109.1 glycosyl transferase group 1 [Sulfolobus acidocaldarius Ron12/I]ALU29974.1 group 1 glycosyl transferase [Sulfolobus acidocaldarius]WCM35714.1 glycosyltransferase [Sulfolobus acidocaldarius DSM 639]